MKYLTANEIRSRFLDFFKSKGHTIVASDSVVPKDDPTVLFTTAGMQQFKRQFLGNIDSYTRAATSQKCIRTDDLDVVGKTNCHHTFFEMLGNFSFGDYFKSEAIHWAWEFLTQVLEIPKERLWVSVYQDDQEAFEIWKNAIGIPEHKIFKLGDKSNFWPSNAKQNGPNGPCGPCSEIFFDYDPADPSVPKDPDDIAGRFTEVWNLVFTQFNRKDGGILEPLPARISIPVWAWNASVRSCRA
ncbi:MAG TPA: alanine--tRNA ligase-related protein [Candidatus Omnitrophota bacterium]|nr:alanine--tRNA ligase-related protein [Candidatus Omnitrophota bacterium]